MHIVALLDLLMAIPLPAKMEIRDAIFGYGGADDIIAGDGNDLAAGGKAGDEWNFAGGNMGLPMLARDYSPMMFWSSEVFVRGNGIHI